MNNDVYIPAEDTELIMDMIKIKDGETVLDMGSGTGILSLHALKLGAKRVLSIDVNPNAADATLCTLKSNGFSGNVLNCYLLDCIRNTKFDVAIFNPPYLPFEEYDNWLGYSWSGGKSGIDILLSFLSEVMAERVYIVYSSLSDEDKLMSFLEERFIISSRKEIKIGLERLIGLELIKNDDQASNS
ncbi:methyltransferase [Sulfolobus acidocaldarius SUSAZ]|nr:methyltransferase [Sulfolobus acidocaldarius SUSAZ]